MNFNFPKQYRHFQRYRQIAQILLKNGLGFIVDWLDLSKYLPFKKRLKKDTELNKKSFALRFRHVLQELGPSYIKLGQVLSTRADILPPLVIQELRKLQDKVPSVPFSEIEKVLIEELGSDYKKHFQKLDTDVLAAASIAQIYHAVLKNGDNVILKIQRPGIEKVIRVDLEILHNLAVLAEERKILPNHLKATTIIKEFSSILLKELNFQREIANIKRFNDNFHEEEDIIVPKVYEQLSSKRLIVMEEIKGIKLNNLAEEKEIKIDRNYLATLGAQSLLKQIFIDGFFHADPHPGNIFIVDKGRLAYIDFGMMGELTEEGKRELSILLIALLKKDVNIIADTLIEIGIVDDEINYSKFKLEIQDLINRYYGADLKQMDFRELADDIQRILYNYQVRLPEEFIILIRAIAVSQGVGLMIDPSFDLVEVGNSFLKELLLDKLNTNHLINYLLEKFWNLRQATKGLPRKLRKIIDKLTEDNLSINFLHKNLDGLINKLDIVSNRLSISLIISALIIGSSTILQTEMKPIVFGIPLLGFLGFIIAGIMGLWLVISIFRSGRF